MELPADYHVHTYLCKHADGDPEDYLAAATARGLPEICFTDHAPAPCGYDPKHRMMIDQVPTYHNILAGLPRDGACKVRVGIEADYYPDCEQFLRPWLESQPFDLVMGSVHYIQGWGFDNPDNLPVWETVDVEQTWRRYFELVGRLAQSRLFDMVAHLDLPKKFGHRPRHAALVDAAKRALDQVAAAGMGIELNTSGLRRKVAEIYPAQAILELARARDIPICFGSDAHQPEEVGHAFDKAVRLARAAGYTACARFVKRRLSLVPLDG